MSFRTVFVLLAAGWMHLAGAACNNPDNWLEGPSEGVKTFVGYRDEMPHYFFADMFNGILDGWSKDQPYPPPLDPALLDKPWQGQLSSDAEAISYISYFEPDGKGGWRICREESWANKKPNADAYLKKQYQSNALTHKDNLLVAPWLKTHYTWTAKIYRYDERGRVKETFSAQVPGQSADPRDIAGLYKCFRFDDKDRPQLYVDATGSKTCPTGEPDPRDFFVRIAYIDFALPDGSKHVLTSWFEKHYGKPNGDWVSDVDFRRLYDPDNPDPNKWFQGGLARVLPGKGVEKIVSGYFLGRRDESVGPSFKLVSGTAPHINYYFPTPPVPIDLLKAPETIYQYDRRRETEITRVIKLYEYFPAHVTRLRERFFAAFGRTLRHEQLDDQGRLRRAINVGRFSRSDEGFGFYDEDLEHANISWKLKGHELYYRVWDYDTEGKATLVALGWGKGIDVGEPEKIDDAHIVFGTPDGKVKWKDQAAFFKAFDFDPTAIRAFPEEQAKR